ncbi:hypothetical protein Tco_1221717, partial [Tanacetum coccineum]
VFWIKASLEKSLVFFGNVSASTMSVILGLLPFSVGTLPIKYLGMPLITSRLYKHHFAPLIDKVNMKLLNWKNIVMGM